MMGGSCCWGKHASGSAYIPSEEVLRVHGPWVPPDEATAHTRGRAEHVHHSFFDVWSSRVRDLKEFGVGHMLYFSYLWWMAALFCVLSVLVAAPNIGLNLAGTFYEPGALLELTSLGNFGRVSLAHSHDGTSSFAASSASTGWQHENAVSQAFLSDGDGDAAPPARTPFDKRAAIVAASVIDCCGAVLFFVVTLVLVLLARRRAEDADVHTVTIHDYSVYAQQLPADAQSGELSEFFSQWGPVESVEVVRAYGSLIQLALRRGELLQRLQSATAALRRAAQQAPQVPAAMERACLRLRDDVDEVEAQIQLEQAQGDTRRVVGAFVTFRDEAAKLACLAATPNSWVRQLWSLKAQHRFRGRHALSIREAPEPSDVIFENMEAGRCERLARALLVAVLSYAALCFGFLLISLASAAQVNLARSAGIDTAACASRCRLQAGGSGGLGVADADRQLYAACASTGQDPDGAPCSADDSICYRCFCFSALTSGMLSESSYCSSAVGLLALQYSGQAGVIMAILGINFLLALTSRRLTQVEKHHTRSAEARSLAHKLFLAQFMNSALSTIVANAHLPFLATLLEGSALSGIFFQGIFTDLTPKWYATVGRSLLISQFVAATLRVVYLVLRRLSVWHSTQRRGACLTQEELDAALRGPDFLLDHRWGEHLSVTYVCMLLSGGMPLAYVAAALWFVAAYWCDKWELLSLSRRPVTYGADLPNAVMNLLPYAAVWHVAFGLWAFSLFGVPRSRLVSGLLEWLVSNFTTRTSLLWENATGISPEQAAQRLLSATGAHLLIVFAVLVAVLFLKLTFTMWLSGGRYLLNLLGLVADKEDTHATGAPQFTVAVRTQLLVGQTSYAITQQAAYAAAFSRVGCDEGAAAGGDAAVQVALRAARGGKEVPRAGQQGMARRASSAAVLAAGSGSPRSQSLLADASPALAGIAGWQAPVAAGEQGVPTSVGGSRCSSSQGSGRPRVPYQQQQQQQQQQQLQQQQLQQQQQQQWQQQHWDQQQQALALPPGAQPRPELRQPSPAQLHRPQSQPRANQVAPMPPEVEVMQQQQQYEEQQQ